MGAVLEAGSHASALPRVGPAEVRGQLGRTILREHAHRSGGQGSVRGLPPHFCGQDHDQGLGDRVLDGCDQGPAIPGRHRHVGVEQHDVGLRTAHHVERALAIKRRSDHLEHLCGSKSRCQQVTQPGVSCCNDDPEHVPP